MESNLNLAGVLAAVDMGSNSVRLEIAQMAQGRYRRIDYLKDTVRLGAGLDADGNLGEEAAERGLACLQRFAQRLAGFEPAQVRAVATQTLREARNRDAYLARCQQVLGFPIEVISGREEARLTYVGVAQLQPSDEPRLVIDIGGRSTELILGQGTQPQVAESFGIGCVSLSQRFFEDGRLGAASFRAAQVAAGAEFEEALQAFAPSRWTQAMGSSGTAGAVSQVLKSAGITDGRITPAALQWCIDRCLAAGHIDRIQIDGLKPERRAVLPGGLAILSTLAAQFGIATMQPAKGALRQGVIVELHQRLQGGAGGANGPDGTNGNERANGSAATAAAGAGGDMRHGAVAELQRRFRCDTAQAARVAATALALFDAVQPAAAAETRRELAWACALHELGLMVSHHDHHRHSAYLVAHADAAGFSQNQQRRMADLVLAQRGGLRKVDAQLASEVFAWQVLCLRLAVIEHHARDAQAPALSLRAKARQATLRWPAGWPDAHPRTLYLLREEAAAWARLGSGNGLRLAL